MTDHGAGGAWRYLDSTELADIAAKLSDWRAAQRMAGALVLVAEQSAAAVPAIQQAFTAAGVPVLGAIYPALIVGDRFVNSGVLMLAFETMPPSRLLPDISSGSEATVTALADFVADHAGESGNDTLFLVFDCLVPNVASLIDGVYVEVGDQVHYAGANAGSETFQPTPCLFDNQRLLGDAVLAILLRNHPGALLEHGYGMTGQPVLASSTQGNRVSQIMGQPAFEQYRRLAAERYGVEVSQENFYQVAAHFPFGLIRMAGDILVRIPVALADDGAIYCVGEIPENSMLAVLSATEPGSMTAVQRVAADMASRLDGHGLFFYCAGRRMHLQSAAEAELAVLQQSLGRPLVGALSLGEIGNSRQGGHPLFHNATIVAMSWQ